MAEKKKSKDKKDADVDEILLSKNPEEYTFQPNAHKYKGLKSQRQNTAGSPVA